MQCRLLKYIYVKPCIGGLGGRARRDVLGARGKLYLKQAFMASSGNDTSWNDLAFEGLARIEYVSFPSFM